ncbi:molybdopterin-binding protein [Phyllobacterium sp. LjRoot231]|uniref:molybdopterin-binding protein n=1 Tax=Phyllobacterium sp. LjRoot231 TaxID=3342289 RepID=UPI003ED147DD
MSFDLTRRRFLIGSSVAATGLLTGCGDGLVQSTTVNDILQKAESLTMGAQRLLMSQQTLAREFSEADISPLFKGNGTTQPDSEDYTRMTENNFADWKLVVNGMVKTPLNLSLADLKAMPSRTQITRHDCVEGWSAIGKWTGVPLGLALEKAGLAPGARYAVFHCADDLEPSLDGSGRYYESIDLVDAWHPQTILAYSMNGKDLEVAHGAPLRLRVERQLGYKHAKYVMGIELVDSFKNLAGGKGGFWEDRGYEWYAGI